MVLKTIPETNIKFIEITGIGENISDEKRRIYFSKSGADVVSQSLYQVGLFVTQEEIIKD